MSVRLAEVAQSHEGDTYATKVFEGKARSAPRLNSRLYLYCRSTEGGIYIGENSSLRQRILEEMHDSAIGGHSGIVGTYQRSKRFFFWMGIKKYVHSLGVIYASLAKERTYHIPGYCIYQKVFVSKVKLRLASGTSNYGAWSCSRRRDANAVTFRLRIG